MTILKHNRSGICRRLVRNGAFAAVCLAALIPGAARAGFEWTPPPVVKHDAGPIVQAVPVPEVSITPAEAALPAEEAVIDTTPFTAPSLAVPVPAAAKTEQPLKTEDREYAMAEGFGRDIPLALVMQQIVPPAYSYSFDSQINPGMRVSWDGGKPWNKVLEETVKPFHLEVVVSGMTVWLRPAAENAADLPADTATAQADITPAPEMKSGADEPYISRMKEIESMGYEKLEMTGDTAANTVAAPPRELITDPAQLAVIGKDDAGYRPSYPRRIPVPLVPTSTANTRADAAPQPISPAIASEKLIAAEARNDNPFAEAIPVQAPAADPVSVPKPQVISYEHKDSQIEEVVAAAPPKDAPAVLDPSEIRFWQAEKDASLKETLSAWASVSGVKLYWGAGSDYLLPKAIRAHGTFPDAVMEVLSSYGEAADRPLGRLHPNLPDGPSVLLIQSSGSATAVN